MPPVTPREQLSEQFKSLVSPAQIREIMHGESGADKDLPGESVSHSELAFAAAKLCEQRDIIPSVLDKLLTYTHDRFPEKHKALRRIDPFDAHQMWLTERHDKLWALRLWPLTREPTADERRTIAADLDRLERFEHPHVARMSGGCTGPRYVALATPFYAASTIQYWLSGQAPRWRSILRVFIKIGRALSAAHAAGIYHGDIRLENILFLDDDAPVPDKLRLVGFDIQLDARLRKHTYPYYEAPERCASHGPATAHSDQFSFCVALFLALYRAHPFHRNEGNNNTGLLISLANPEFKEADTKPLCDALRNKELTPKPAGLDSPKVLYRILQRGLQRDLGSRFPAMNDLLDELERERRRILPRRSATICLVTAAVVALLVVTRAVGPIACWRDESVESLVSAADRARIQDAFADKDHPSNSDTAVAVVRELTAYAHEILAVHQQICRENCDTYDPRAECLAGRRADLREAIEAFTDPTSVSRVDLILSTLAPVSDCALPVARVCRDASEPLRQARAAERRREFQEAADLAAVAMSSATAAGDQASLADAAFLRGRALAESGQVHDAEAALTSAITAADVAQCDGLLIDASNRLSKLNALNSNTGSTVLSVPDLLGRLDRMYAGERDHRTYRRRKAEALKNRGLLRQRKLRAPACVRQGQPNCPLDLEGARRDFNEALLLLRDLDPPQHAALSIGHQTLGSVLFQLERADEASIHFKTSIDLATLAFGRDNPAQWRVRFDFGKALLDAGRAEEAGPYLSQALALVTRALGDGHVKVGETHLQLAQYYQDTRQLPLMLDSATKARDLFKPLLASDNRPFNADRMYADALMAVGRYPESLPVRKALLTAARSRDAEEMATANVELAETYHALGMHDEAADHAKAARDIGTIDPLLAGEIALYQGCAMRAKDASAAIHTLEDARAAFERKSPRELIEPALWVHATWELAQANCDPVSDELSKTLDEQMPQQAGKQATATILRIFAEIHRYDSTRCKPLVR
jgi:tetratricopeptide (TPR) repeat protein